MKLRQPTKNNPFHLPHNVYMQTLFLVRDFDRLSREYEDLINETSPNDGMPKGGGVGDPTGSNFIKIETIGERLNAVKKAESAIPPEYRKAVVMNTMYGERYPDLASRNTWSLHRSRFIFNVAKNMRWA